jgi:hypothetical protein
MEQLSSARRATGDNEVRPSDADWVDSSSFLGRPRRLGGGEDTSGDDNEEPERAGPEFWTI